MIVDWLERTGAVTFTRREYHRAHESRFPKAADLDPAMKLLDERGWIHQIDQGRAGPKGGRPASPTYLVNEWWRHNRQNGRNPAVGQGSVGCGGCVGEDFHIIGGLSLEDKPHHDDRGADSTALAATEAETK